MSILERVMSARPEAGLWLAGLAACSGLVLAWRWRRARGGQRNRALRVLGYIPPVQPVLGQGLRYAGILAVAILTVLGLTPATRGVGDTERVTAAPPPVGAANTPGAVTIELDTQAATIVVRGGAVEIHLVPVQAAPMLTDVGGPYGVADPTATQAAAPSAEFVPQDWQ